MTYSRFLYDAAERRARDLDLSVVSVCHASLPAGVPVRDHLGNYVTAKTIYIGKPGTIEKQCAYGRAVHSIHQSNVSMGDALSDIADALRTIKEFQTRANYEAYFLPGCRNVRDIDAMAVHWRDVSNTAHRAKRCLPPDLVTWLETKSYTGDV